MQINFKIILGKTVGGYAKGGAIINIKKTKCFFCNLRNILVPLWLCILGEKDKRSQQRPNVLTKTHE